MPTYYKPVFRTTTVSPVNSMTAQLKQFREAIVYWNNKPFKAIARQVKTAYPSVADGIFSPIFQIIVGVGTILFPGLVDLTALPAVTVFNLFVDIGRMLMNRFSPSSVEQFRINTGLVLPRLLGSVSAVIGGALLVASSPFVAMVRLGRTLFPETFGVKFDNNNDSSSRQDSDEPSSNQDDVVNYSPLSSHQQMNKGIPNSPSDKEELPTNMNSIEQISASNVSPTQDDTTGLSQNSIFAHKNTHPSETTLAPQSTISNSLKM